MRKLVLVCLLTLLSASAALADCYDVFGCSNQSRFRLRDLVSGPTCDFLYAMRNGIYAEHHLCFRTARAQSSFGNEGCVSANPNAIGLNATELYNASVILQAEHAKGCPE